MYAFAGLVGFWIDDKWTLVHLPLNLLALDGDHTGRATGRLVYKSLAHRQIADKISTSMKRSANPLISKSRTNSLVASATDNASSNGTMNVEIVRLIVKYWQLQLDAKQIQIG